MLVFYTNSSGYIYLFDPKTILYILVYDHVYVLNVFIAKFLVVSMS